MRLILAFALLVQVSACFHYTCEQIKNELIPKRVQIPAAKYACVVFEIPLDQLDVGYAYSTYIKDLATGVEHSLASVYNECSYCVEGKGPWQVIRRGQDTSYCSHELVLLFTSVSTIVQPANVKERLCPPTYNSLKTIVAPNSGSIQLGVTPQKDKVEVYLGVGKDESEGLHLIEGSDTSFSMTIFDWVVSVSFNYASLYINTPDPDYTNIRFDTPNPPSLWASAIQGNPQWQTYMLNAKTLAGLQDTRQPVIRVTGNVHYNSSNVLAIKQNYKEIDLKSGDVRLTMCGDFEITYFTHPNQFVFSVLNETIDLSFELIGFSHDCSSIDIPTEPTRAPTRLTTQPAATTLRSTKQPSPTVPPSKATTAPPTRVTTVIPTIPPSTTRLPTTTVQTVNAESYCVCDLDENGIAKSWASQLWLDIVILVDTSKTMGKDGADEISSLIESLVGKMNLDSEGPSNLYSRVGLISLANTATVVYNLNMTSDSDVDLKGSDGFQVDIAAGIQLALKMFQDGRKMPNYRESAREIIYFITNSAPQGIMNGAFEFKSSGGIIIVANYVREGQVPLDSLKSLASPNFYFTDLTDNYAYNLQVFCDANCFCPPDLHPFTDGSVNPRQDANRGCYNVATLGIPYKNAVKTCQKESAVMTSIHDDDKQFFLASIVSNFGPKTKYWIGYENDGNSWYWVDKSTDPYANWDVANGQPNTNGGQNLCAYAVQTTGLKSEWYAANCDGGFNFVCERAPCAAGRYCIFED